MRGNRVYFLGPPGKKYSIDETKFKNVWKLDYPGFLKGLRFFPDFFIKHIIKRVFSNIESLVEVKIDVIWSFDNSVFFDFDAIPKNVLKISHIVDMSQDFQMEKAAKTADISFAVTKNILNKILRFQKNVFFINHGYDNQEFENKEIYIRGSGQVKVMYGGNLNIPSFDWELFMDLIEANENVDFHLIGPEPAQSIIEKFSNYNNVFLEGKKDSIELKSWYKIADILIVIYKEEHCIELTNTHKMMGYLGSGKMIVATNTLEYKNLADSGLIAMSDTNDKYVDIFKDIAENIDYWNSDMKRKKRKSYALNNTYEKQIQKIEKYINLLKKNN